MTNIFVYETTVKQCYRLLVFIHRDMSIDIEETYYPKINSYSVQKDR